MWIIFALVIMRDMHVSQQILQEKLGDSLIAVHHFHDAPSTGRHTESNRETIAVVSETISIDEIRGLRDLPHFPQIVSATHFPFLRQVAPLLNAQIDGTPLPHDAEIAHFATQALFASAELRTPTVNAGLQTLSDSLSVTGNAKERLVRVLEKLEQMVDGVQLPKRDDAPAELPELRAFYEEIDMAIVVLPDAATVGQIDWENVEGVFGRKFTTLLITTASLLPLLATHDLAVPFAIDRFRHTWGADPIPALNVPLPNLLRNAAQTILKLGTVTFPHTLICTPEEQFGTLIHNIQNQLLKIQFQYELLSMIYELSPLRAPRLSAERTLPNRQRIINIKEHIAAWLALYQQLLQTVG